MEKSGLVPCGVPIYVFVRKWLTLLVATLPFSSSQTFLNFNVRKMLVGNRVILAAARSSSWRSGRSCALRLRSFATTSGEVRLFQPNSTVIS